MKYNKGMPLYAVFPLLYREDVLSEAWKRVKANKGSSGVDGIEIEDIETMGIEKYLTEIKEELMDGKYKPSPVVVSQNKVPVSCTKTANYYISSIMMSLCTCL